MSDTLEIFGQEWTGVTGIKATDDNDTIKTFIRPQGTISISQNGQGIDVSQYASANVAVPSSSPTIDSLTVTPSTSQQVFNSSSVDGYKPVTVGAIPIMTQYTTGIDGQYTTVNNQRKYVANGYIEAYEAGYLGNNFQPDDYLPIGERTYNAVPANTTITPSTSAQTVGGANYMMEGAVTVSGDANLVAGNIKSGTTIFGVAGTYSGGSSKNAQAVTSTTRVTSTSLTACSGTITVAKTGTYDVYWSTHRTSTSGSWSSRLYVNNTASGTEQTSGWSNHVQPVHLTNVSLTAGQTIRVYAKSRGSNYYAYVPLLTIIES